MGVCVRAFFKTPTTKTYSIHEKKNPCFIKDSHFFIISFCFFRINTRPEI